MGSNYIGTTTRYMSPIENSSPCKVSHNMHKANSIESILQVPLNRSLEGLAWRLMAITELQATTTAHGPSERRHQTQASPTTYGFQTKVEPRVHPNVRSGAPCLQANHIWAETACGVKKGCSVIGNLKVRIVSAQQRL